MEKRATLADVAAAAGVDRSLASRVLNNDPARRAREEVQERIRQAARDLGYQPNRAARSLRTSKSGAIGLVIPGYENPAWSRVLEGAQTEADRRGLMLTSASAEGHPQRVSQFFALGRQGGLDGLLIGTSAHINDPLKEASIPWLMVYRRTWQAKRYVTIDDTEAARIATEELISHGHRRLVHVAGPSDVDSATRRLEGFLAAMADHGLEPEGVLECPYTIAAGRTAATDMATKFPEATGAVVANFPLAAGFLAGLQAHRVKVPEELSVISIQDDALADAFAPRLTTVRMPLFHLGERAVSLLLDHAADQDIEETIVTDIEIIRRASVTPPR